ncbi:MAG: hypothetical protein JXB88_05970 [Spirochaetales bacterium]|nr:hypothetical protein [Spirochaetales bacterium]
MLFETSYKELDSLCELVIDNKLNEAKNRAEKMLEEHISHKTSNEKLLLHIFTSALIARVDRKSIITKNIYLQKFDIPQIVLFYEMTKAYPQVKSSHFIANQYIEHAINKMLIFTLFDIGIGKGKQIESLINTIGEKNINIKQINIIGLDPDIDNIRFTEELFDKLKSEVYFDLNYYPICNLLENFSARDYNFVKEIAGENLIINAAYSLHHISHPINDTDYRTDIFCKLKSLHPRLFTLIEPNSNHDIELLSRRARNCWNHFSTVFTLIDQASIEGEHKFLIKDKFFGREIRDIFGASDYLRSERHEDLGSWMFRLIRAGFKPYQFHDVSVQLPSYCDFKVGEGLVRLGYKSIPLIAIFAYH